MVSFFKKFASLKVSVCLLVAFLLLTFWGVLAQANAESLGASAEIAADRFFNSFFVMALGVVPIPAFKALALFASLHLVLCMVYRMPRGWKNLGLYGMHVALLVLLAGGVVGSSIKREFNGFGVVTVKDGVEKTASGIENASGIESAHDLKFFALDDSLGTNPLKIENAYPYSVHYKGYVEMAPGKNVALFRAVYDPFKFVPYAFMLLFLLSAVFHYAVKVRGGRCNRNLESNQEKRSQECRAGTSLMALLLCCGLMGAMPANASEVPENAIFWLGTRPEDPVLVGETIRPFDSFARGVLDDFSGRVTYKYREADHADGKISAADVIEEVYQMPERASKFALFKVLRSDVATVLDLPTDERYVSYEDLQRSRGKLEVYASRNDDHPATLEMKRLLKNVQLYEAVAAGEIPRVKRLEEQLAETGKMQSEYKAAAESFAKSKKLQIDYGRLKMETFYNKVNFALFAFVLAFAGCLLAAVNSIFKSRKLDAMANSFSGAVALVLTAAFVLRFYIAARPPFSSLYEIVLLVALLLEFFEFGAFLFCCRRTFTLMIPVTMMAAVLLFFAKFILEPGDLFQPIPAVLDSSVFLTIHVFTIALGFAGMILSGIVAHAALVRSRSSDLAPRTSNLAPLLYGTLVFGTVFSIVGTLLGGVWADFAWGRFWGFDPKECGALFVCLWGMLALHLRAGRLVSELGFALFNCFNVIVTFLCWFGINLLGVGLHSYGFQNGTAMWLLAFVVIDTVAVILLSYRKFSFKK